MRVLFSSVGVVALLTCSAPTNAFAQLDTATVIGTATDNQGGVLPGVTVTVRNIDTGFTRAVVTDPEGRYRAQAVPPGRYEFAAELGGFNTAVRRGVTLTLGSESVINFELSLANVAEQITVTAESPVIQTTTSTVQTTITREAIDLLPLIGRSYQSLLRLTPGAVSNNSSYSFAGSRGRSNQWTIDGVDNSEDISGYSRQDVAVDSIQEIQVLVNGFKAEFGQASGGLVNVVTRGGTNVTHGSGFFLFRNQELMSRSPYADRTLPTDPFRRIHYGGTVGGPIKQDKLHYFLTYEREDRDTFSASTRTLPSRNATFSPATLQFLQQHNIPLTIFPDIPAGETLRIRQTREEFVNVHKATGRLDYQASSEQFVTGTFRWDRELDPSGAGGTLFDFNGATDFFRTSYGNLNHKWIVSSNKLNEAYFQFGQSFGDWKVSYPSLRNLSITGGFTLGGTSNYPQGRTDYIYQAVDNFTWTVPNTRTGQHSIKAGAQIKILRSDSFFDSNFRGTYTFPSLTAFLQGTPSRFTQNQGDTTLGRPNQIYGFYLQDDWRPNESLTLNVGLRYDYEAARTEALRDVTGEPGPGIGRDKNNFAPRVGFAWAPGGSTQQSFYGGTGVYYDQIILNVIGNARFTPPKVIGVQIDNPTWPDPFAGGTVSIPTPNVSIIDPELSTPHEWSSQIGYRRELTRDLGLDVSFIYKRGYDHVFIVNTNACPPGAASFTGACPANSRPSRDFTNISFYTNNGELRYKGLLIDLKKRMSRNFQGGIAYTIAKVEDNSFNFVSGLQVPERPDLNWGPGDTDRRHLVESHLEYNLPWNIQLGTIVEYRSEAPLDIFASGRDLNGDGITGDWVNEAICRGGRPGVPAGFVQGCPGFNYARNSVREVTLEQANALRALFGLAPIEKFENNPQYFNVDLTLQKRIRIGTQGFRVTAEAFNVLNIPQRDQPNTNIFDTSGFGLYSSVSQPRAVQFTVQWDF